MSIDELKEKFQNKIAAIKMEYLKKQAKLKEEYYKSVEKIEQSEQSAIDVAKAEFTQATEQIIRNEMEKLSYFAEKTVSSNPLEDSYSYLEPSIEKEEIDSNKKKAKKIVKSSDVIR